MSALESLRDHLEPWKCCGAPPMCGIPCQDDELSDCLARAYRLVDKAIKDDAALEADLAELEAEEPAVQAAADQLDAASRRVPDLMTALEQSLAKAKEEQAKPRCQSCNYPENALHHQGQGKGAHPFVGRDSDVTKEADR